MVTYNPSSSTRNIQVLEMVYSTATTITYPASGAQIAQSTPFYFEGRLVFYEGTTPYGLTGMDVVLSYGPSSNPDQFALGSVKTGSDGVFSKSVMIEQVGSWTLKARFIGALGYTASSKTVASIVYFTGGVRSFLGYALAGLGALGIAVAAAVKR